MSKAEYVFTGNWKNWYFFSSASADATPCHFSPFPFFPTFTVCRETIFKCPLCRFLGEACRSHSWENAIDVVSVGLQVSYVPFCFCLIISVNVWAPAKIIGWCLLTDPVVWNFTLRWSHIVNFKTQALRLQSISVCRDNWELVSQHIFGYLSLCMMYLLFCEFLNLTPMYWLFRSDI